MRFGDRELEVLFNCVAHCEAGPTDWAENEADGDEDKAGEIAQEVSDLMEKLVDEMHCRKAKKGKNL